MPPTMRAQPEASPERTGNNEEYRRNQHGAAREGGISVILVAQERERGQPQEAQHSDPKGEPAPTAPARCAPLGPRPGAGIEDGRSARAVAEMISIGFPSKGRRPFPTRLRKTLRRYWGARVSSAWLSRASGAATAAAAPSPWRYGWKKVFIIKGKFTPAEHQNGCYQRHFLRVGREARGEGFRAPLVPQRSRSMRAPAVTGAAIQMVLNRMVTSSSGSRYCRSRDQSHGMTSIRFSSY